MPTGPGSPFGTSNANVFCCSMNSRPLPPMIVPENVPPCRSTGTSERRTTGTTVWSPELSEITRSWPLSPGLLGSRVCNRKRPVCPGRSVRLDGLTLSTPPKRSVANSRCTTPE